MFSILEMYATMRRVGPKLRTVVPAVHSAVMIKAHVIALGPWIQSHEATAYNAKRVLCSLDAFAGCYQDTGLIASGLPYYTPSGLDLPYAFIAGLELNITSSDSPSVRKSYKIILGYRFAVDTSYDTGST